MLALSDQHVCDHASMLGPQPSKIEDGALVIIYERHDSLSYLYTKAGDIFNSKWGCFHHNDLIGQPYGTKVSSVWPCAKTLLDVTHSGIPAPVAGGYTCYTLLRSCGRRYTGCSFLRTETLIGATALVRLFCTALR